MDEAEKLAKGKKIHVNSTDNESEEIHTRKGKLSNPSDRHHYATKLNTHNFIKQSAKCEGSEKGERDGERGIRKQRRTQNN